MLRINCANLALHGANKAENDICCIMEKLLISPYAE